MALQSAENAKAIFRHPAQLCVRRIGGREPASAVGIDRKEVDENFADNFVWQRQDRILVGIESSLSKRSLTSHMARLGSVLEIVDLGIEIHDASTVCCKGVDHGHYGGQVLVYNNGLQDHDERRDQT
ncbi:hypothetical protein B0H14DRAFT_2616315 [Mycena olivaceomarginata]|nr:hypothetical protein B0H14DRAFT_2616315 [Mycena olivaceomarginata]